MVNVLSFYGQSWVCDTPAKPGIIKYDRASRCVQQVKLAEGYALLTGVALIETSYSWQAPSRRKVLPGSFISGVHCR